VCVSVVKTHKLYVCIHTYTQISTDRTTVTVMPMSLGALKLHFVDDEHSEVYLFTNKLRLAHVRNYTGRCLLYRHYICRQHRVYTKHPPMSTYMDIHAFNSIIHIHSYIISTYVLSQCSSRFYCVNRNGCRYTRRALLFLPEAKVRGLASSSTLDDRRNC